MKFYQTLGWWTLILSLSGFGTFMMIVNYENRRAARLDLGRFHAAVLTVTAADQDFPLVFQQAPPFYEAFTRAELAWQLGFELDLAGHHFAAGTIQQVHSRVTTHSDWSHYQLSGDWARNIDPCTCREHQQKSLIQRFEAGLTGLIAAGSDQPQDPGLSLSAFPGGR